MKKLWYSYLKELKLSTKGFYFYVEFIMAFLIIFILLFLIPEEMSSYKDEYIYLEMPEQIEALYIARLLEDDLDGKVESAELELDKEMLDVDLYITEDQNLYIIAVKDDMIALAKADRPDAAASVTWVESDMDFKYDYYLQGYESDRLKNLLMILHSEDLDEINELSKETEIVALDSGFEQLNARQMAVPSLMSFNGALMGMFIIAAYIFLDKSEGVIKAYAVTASKVWHYLMSKAMVMTTVTVITTLAIAIAVMGTQPNYPMLLLLLVTSSFAASSYGLIIASYYDNMTKAFAAIYMSMMVFMLPAIAYFMPSWQPLWVRIIPTHFLIQGFKEVVLVNGDMAYVALASAVFLAAGILMFLWSNMRFKKNLGV